MMIEQGIFAPLLPEITDAKPLARLVGREQTFCQPGDPIRRLAALLPPEPGLATAIATRLKFSRIQRNRLATATAPIPGDLAKPRALAYRHGMESAIDRLLLYPTNDVVSGNAIANLTANPPPERFPIKGGALIAMGMDAGPEVARILREIEEAWIAEDFPDENRVRELAQNRVISE